MEASYLLELVNPVNVVKTIKHGHDYLLDWLLKILDVLAEIFADDYQSFSPYYYLFYLCPNLMQQACQLLIKFKHPFSFMDEIIDWDATFQGHPK